MNSRNAAVPDAVVRFAPKPNGKAETGDTLEKAGHLILEMIGKAGASETGRLLRVARR